MALNYHLEYQRYKKYYTYLGGLAGRPAVRAYFSLIVSLFTIAIFFAFAIRPTLATIITLRKEIADKKELMEKLDNKINSLSALQIAYQQAEDDLPYLAKALPTVPELGEAVSWLEKTSTASGVNVDRFATANIAYSQQASGSAVFIPIDIGLGGGYENILNFLSQVNSLPRVYAIRDLEINKDNSSSVDDLSSRILMRTYFFP